MAVGPRFCIRAGCHRLGVAGALALGLVAAPGVAAQTLPASPVARACAGVPPADDPASADLVAARTAVMASAQRGESAAVRRACAVAQQLAATRAPDDVDTLRWSTVVAGALIWQRRLDDAHDVGRHAYDALASRGHPAPDDAAYGAGVLAIVWAQRGDLQRALEWSSAALVHQQDPRSTLDADTRLVARVNHATMLSQARRFDEAIAAFDQVRTDAAAAQPPVKEVVANAMRGLVLTYVRQGRPEPALAMAQAEVDYRRRELPGNPMQMGTAWQNVASQRILLSDFAGAQAALEEALQAQAAGGVDLFGSQASTLETLAGLQADRGDTTAALATAQRAVELLRSAGPEHARTVRMALALRRLSGVQLAAGDLPGALASARQAIAIFDALPATTHFAAEFVVREVDARVQLQLGAPRQALEAVERTRERAGTRRVSPQERATLHLIEAAARHRLGDREAATQAMARAGEALASSAVPDAHPLRQTVAAQACALDGTGCRALSEAVQAGRQVLLPADEVSLQIGLALHHAADPAARLAATTQAVWAALASGRPALRAWALAEHAQALAANGREPEAIFFAKKAVDQVEAQRTQVAMALGVSAEGAYMADKERPYRHAAELLAASGRIAEAVEMLRLLRRREMHDFVERGGPAVQPAGARSLTAVEARLDALLEAAIAEQFAAAAEADRLRERVAARRATPDEIARLAAIEQAQRQSRDSAQRRWVETLDAMRALAGREAVAPVPQAAADPRRPARADTLHAYFVTGPSTTTLIVVGARGQAVRRLPVSSAQLGVEVAALLDALRQRRDALGVAQRLYRMVGEPLDAEARRAGAGTLLLGLDGPLRYLPFGYLHDGRAHLAERYLLARTGEAAGTAAPATPAAAGAAVSGPRRMQAFGVTRAFAGLPQLPGVGSELCGILRGPIVGLDPGRDGCARGTGTIDGQGAANEHFTAQALARHGELAAPGGLLHIGTHFVLRPGNARHSWLLTGDGQRLTVDELSRLPTARPALVTLSACDTAVPAQGANGREVEGLASVLLGQGAGAVVATLWQVDDRRTARLMKDFYQALARHPEDVPRALGLAQRQRLRADAGAPDWAAVVLTVPTP